MTIYSFVTTFELFHLTFIYLFLLFHALKSSLPGSQCWPCISLPYDLCNTQPIALYTPDPHHILMDWYCQAPPSLGLQGWCACGVCWSFILTEHPISVLGQNCLSEEEILSCSCPKLSKGQNFSVAITSSHHTTTFKKPTKLLYIISENTHIHCGKCRQAKRRKYKLHVILLPSNNHS